MSWTDERVDLLKKLWAEGRSCSQIANRLGGVTRNAVIGKVCRLGLPRRARTNTERGEHYLPRKGVSRAQQRGGRKAKAKVKSDFNFRAPGPTKTFVDMPPMKADPAHDIARKSLAALADDECKWPTGDPGNHGFGFCALPQFPGLPYCEHHSRRAYLAPNAKTPRPAATVEASNPNPVRQKEFKTAE